MRSGLRTTWTELAAGLGALGLIALGLTPVDAQTAFSADGVVESTSGGFKFPDGTVQTTAAAPGTAPVDATGQQSCWDGSGALIACPGTGQDGEHQLGVGWPDPRFVDNLDGTITDNLTGLIWLQNANCFGSQTWNDTLSDVNDLAGGTCSLTDGSAAGDWRLPNIRELLSLVDYSQGSPPFPAAHPFTNVQSFYWSSSTQANNRSLAWFLDGFAGQAQAIAKTSTRTGWAVRGGQ